MKITTPPTVWIIDDDESIRWVLERALSQKTLTVVSFADADTAWEALQKIEQSKQPAAILCDIRMPGIDGLSFLQQLKTAFPNIPVVIMTAHSDLDITIASFQGGAFDYLPKPFDIEDAVRVVNQALEQSTQHVAPKHNSQSANISEIIGKATTMQSVFRAIGKLSQSKVTVLIIGASGTGKELVAKALHRNSIRKNNAFIALNMAAIPKDLIEAELFGHEKGAFTSAGSQRHGRFEQANGGTLFLDEIGDMPLEAQTRLLRVLAEGEFYRIGGNTPVQIDVRIIAATHQNLETLVAEGKFREDLFHRLNVIRITMPNLAQRSEDIADLADYFLNRAASELTVGKKQLAADVIELFKRLPWPGNVRQLENLCHWLTVMVTGHIIQLADLPDELTSTELETIPITTSSLLSWENYLEQWVWANLQSGNHNILESALPTFETTLIKTAIRHTSGARGEAAKLLGWGRNTLTRKIKELGLESELDSES